MRLCIPGAWIWASGRAPGTDPLTALALRRSRECSAPTIFPRASRICSRSSTTASRRGHRSNASAPCRTTSPCRKSGFSARAIFPPSFPRRWDCDSPSRTTSALARHRRAASIPRAFQPSEYLQQPEALIGVSVVCAETDARAEELARPLALTLLRFRSGKMGRFPSHRGSHELSVFARRAPDHGDESRPLVRRHARQRSAINSRQLADQAGVDEIMITTMTHEHADRRRSYELLAEAFGLM